MALGIFIGIAATLFVLHKMGLISFFKGKK